MDVSAAAVGDEGEGLLDAGSTWRRAPRALVVRTTPARLLRQSVEEWILLVALGAAALRAPLWAYPILGVLLAGRYHALGVILHDAAHLPPRPRKAPLLRLVELLAGYPLGSTIDAIRYHHLRHHRDSGLPADPYFKRGIEAPGLPRVLAQIRGLILVPFWSLRPLLGAVAWRVPGARTAYGRVFLQDRSGESLRASAEVATCGREDLGQLAFTVALVALFAQAPRAAMLLYGLPILGAGLLSSYRLVCEHVYVPCPDRRVETVVATTHDHHVSPWSAVFMAPRNVGYHLVHHLHPQAGLDALPALQAWYRAALPGRYPAPET